MILLLGACLIAALTPGLALAQTPAGTEIINQASVTFESHTGGRSAPSTGQARIRVGRFSSVALLQENRVVTAGGEALALPHILVNRGNMADTFQVRVSAPDAWAARVRLDANGNGTMEPTDPVFPEAGSVVLPGEHVPLLLEIYPPAGLGSASAYSVDLSAYSLTDSTAVAAVTDSVSGPVASVVVTKSADEARVVPGDTIEYRVDYAVSGTGSARSLLVVDTLPESLSLVPSSLSHDGHELSVGPDSAARWNPATGLLTVDLADVPAGTQGSIRFRAVLSLAHPVGKDVSNVAAVHWSGPSGARASRSDPAVVSVKAPSLAVEKTVRGPDPARPGDTLLYQIALYNRSPDRAARALTIEDSLPASLELMAAPGATATARGVEWTVPVLSPGDSVVWTLAAIVADGVSDGDVAINRVDVSTPSGGSWTAHSESRTLLSGRQPSLAMSIESGSLEMALGEMVPFMTTATNDGDVGLRDVRIEIDLPRGVRLGERPVRAFTDTPFDSAAGGSLRSGVQGSGLRPVTPDSVHRHGAGFVVYLPHRLAANRRYVLSFDLAPVSAESSVLEIAGTAYGRRGLSYAVGEVVASQVARLWVRLRQVRPLETRALIGKVFWDRNRNGRQDPGEPGLPDVEVWSEDGEVSRTDRDGQYSFVNVRPGRHVFRVDPGTLPVWAEPSGDLLRTVEADGWTTPHVTFAVISRIGRPAEIRVPGDAPVPEAVTCMRHVECIRTGPVADTVPHGALPDSVELLLQPRSHQRTNFVWRIPDGWHVIDSKPSNPTRVEDGDGVWLQWPVEAGAQTLSLTRTPRRRLEPVTVPPMAEERQGETADRSALTSGPAPSFFAPEDGSVHASERLFVGVEGEPLRPIRLWDGDRLVEEAQFRPDGVVDFINIQLDEGPHLLRASMVNSWGQTRWDSIHVHVGGPPASIAGPDTLTVEAGSHVSFVFRVRDAWDVPLVRSVNVTARATGAVVTSEDVNLSSSGQQLEVRSDGSVRVDLEAGGAPGRYTLLVEAGDVERAFDLVVLPALRPFQMIATGQLAFGSASESFAAVTARGDIGAETAVHVSVDSRRLDADRDAFGRDIGPYEEGQYPTLGDASTRRSPGASRYAVAARIEQGLDYIAFGDLEEETEFSNGLSLARYTRSLPGLAARLATGPVTWRAFGSLTDQTVQQTQIRADGTSGPFRTRTPFVPGTDVVTVEVRARDNASRILTERRLARHVDYQVDARGGRILLRRPLPSIVGDQNPVFLVITYETNSGSADRPLWGLRMQGALGDSTVHAPFGVQMIRDEGTVEAFQMVGVNAGFQAADALDLSAEVAYAESGSRADVATHVQGMARLWDGLLVADGRWVTVGDNFENPSDLRLRSGTEEIEAGAALQVGGTVLSVRRAEQDFGDFGGRRERSHVRVEQALPGALRAQVSAGTEAAQRDSLSEDARFAEGRLSWSPHDRVQVWTEGRTQMAHEGEPLQEGDFVGGGLRLQVLRSVALNARHLDVRPDSGAHYGLTSVGLRTSTEGGSEAWGSYQLVGGVEDTRGAAVLGLSQRLDLAPDLRVRGMFERRVGAERAPLASTVQALPFAAGAQDYWAASLGFEYTPAQRPYRLTGHGEAREGDIESSRRLTLAGDIELGADVAVLGRQEAAWRDRSLSEGDVVEEHRMVWSLLGLAFRPVASDRLNALVKVEWKTETEPARGGLATEPVDWSRAIFAGELIYTPTRSFEIGGRYGRRVLTQDVNLATTALTVQQVSDAQFAALRARWTLLPWLGAEAEGQWLQSRGTSTSTFSIAPGLAVRVQEGLELRGGYRFGDLQDPDFARHSGEGWYVTLGVRLSERSLDTVADFWRERLAR